MENTQQVPHREIGPKRRRLHWNPSVAHHHITAGTPKGARNVCIFFCTARKHFTIFLLEAGLSCMCENRRLDSVKDWGG